MANLRQSEKKKSLYLLFTAVLCHGYSSVSIEKSRSRFREVKWPAQGHTAEKWQSWDLNLNHPDSGALTPTLWWVVEFSLQGKRNREAESSAKQAGKASEQRFEMGELPLSWWARVLAGVPCALHKDMRWFRGWSDVWVSPRSELIQRC